MGCCYDTPPWGSKKTKKILPAPLIRLAKLITPLISFFVSVYAVIYFKELTAIKIFILIIFMTLAWILHNECRRSAAFHNRQNKQNNPS